MAKGIADDSNPALLASFNGPEPDGPELMIRNWKRELEGGREGERKRERHGDPSSDGAIVLY